MCLHVKQKGSIRRQSPARRQHAGKAQDIQDVPAGQQKGKHLEGSRLHAADGGGADEDLVVGARVRDELLGVALGHALRNDGHHADGRLLHGFHAGLVRAACAALRDSMPQLCLVQHPILIRVCLHQPLAAG